jgi:nitrogen-specific signal transduction histidine kinase
VQDRVAIIVSNSGDIPEAIAESFGQPFFTTKGAGRGLGMAVVQGALKNDGGGLYCRAIAMRTEFALVLPYTEVTLSDYGTPTPGGA